MVDASPEELEALRAGAWTAIGAKAANVRGGTATRAAMLTDGTDSGVKVRTICGDDIHADIMGRMEGLEEMARTNAVVEVAKGSHTARMQGSRHNPDNASVAISASPTGLALRGGQKVFDAFIARSRCPA